jgi:sugar phosphate isomerase/epimerase
MKIGICSFAFHRIAANGRMDFAAIARLCQELGCTQLDPWNAHLLEPEAAVDGVRAGRNPHDSRLGTPSDAHVERIAAAGAAVGLPFGCIAIDGAHLLDKDAATEQLNRERALRWIDIAARLRAESVRIDCGGPEILDEATLARIASGYAELIAYAKARNLRVLIENHWGPSVIPANVERILDACPGLGLLFDTNNWKEGLQREGWDRCARRAEVVHVKTFVFDAQGEETSVDLKPAFARLNEAGFRGSWCVESVPRDGDEIEAARRTIALIRRRAGKQAAA